jgi:glycosyltransferase involved in cell wall biosynthesis
MSQKTVPELRDLIYLEGSRRWNQVKNAKHEILIQVGGLGKSVIDHLARPISLAGYANKIIIFSHRPGPAIPLVEYRCPPNFMAKFPILAITYESTSIFFRALSNKSAILGGFLLKPHGMIAFVTAKLTGKKNMVYLIAGRHEFFTNDRNNGHMSNKNSAGLPWYGRLFLNILRHTDAIITTGSVTKGFLVEQAVAEDKIFPIISPVNHSRFFNTNIPKIYDVISIGNLITIKHHETVLRAVAEVRKKYPDIKCCIVGTGPNRISLEKSAGALGITRNVDFAGFQQNVPFYYNSSRIFVHASETEGFPNVFLEAMMCGLPCIVSDCGDIVDIARDGYNSLVVKSFDDYQGFANAITLLLENEELYRHISANALKTVEPLSLENTTRVWKTILTEKLGAN